MLRETKMFILSTIHIHPATEEQQGTYTMYPALVGTLEDIEKNLKKDLDTAIESSVEELSSEDVYAGDYFRKVVKFETHCALSGKTYTHYLGISPVYVLERY